MPKKAVVVVSTSQVISGSDLPREKVELAVKYSSQVVELLEVSSRILRVLLG